MDQNSETPNTEQPLQQPEPNQPVPTEQLATPPVSQIEIVKTPASAGLIVLQWLTYAFWGWTLLALSGLSSIVIYSLIDKIDSSSLLPYVLAAVLVLLPISIVCDIFYSKKETQKKTGASMVVMIIHAVIFALFAIGSLIGAVFSIVQLVLATDGTSNTIAALVSLLIIAVLYAITFLRTLNPFKDFKIAKYYTISMIVVTGIFIVLSFTGPFAQSFLTKDDRRIETNIDGVKQGVDDYVSNNKKLPSNISDVDISDKDAKKLITDGLVTYEKVSVSSDKYSSSRYSSSSNDKTYRYKLCANYKQEKKGSSYSYSSSSSNEYSTYISSYTHPSGEVCYKLEYVDYSSNNY